MSEAQTSDVSYSNIGHFVQAPNYKILGSSPVLDLQNLEAGWDGYDALPPSSQTITRAEQVWRGLLQEFRKEELPAIEPGPDDFVAFIWEQHYPNKRLRLWVHHDGTAEWIQYQGDIPETGKCSPNEVLQKARMYLAA